MEDEFLTAFREALEIQSDVNMEDVFRDHPAWDSLSHMSLIAMLDTEYSLQIENAAFAKMKTVRDIYEYIRLRTTK